MSRSPVKREPPRTPGASVRSPEAPLAEHSLVALRTGLRLDDGRALASGAVGAIVGVWRNGAAYEVEFAEPFHAVVTVSAADLARAPA
jgi:hypothetical protein